MIERVYAYLLSLAVLVAVLWPLRWTGFRDGFPMSSYPMFATRRPDPMMSLSYAVGMTQDGERRWIAPTYVANGEVLQARAVFQRAVSGGKAETERLCRGIAERLVVRGALPEVVRVRVGTGTHDSVAYLVGSDRVGKEKVHAECPVTGRGANGG
jgi:hypothetical protein